MIYANENNAGNANDAPNANDANDANAAADANDANGRSQAREKSVLGCLWGTAVGDALGLSCEGLSKARQQRLFPDAARYHFLFGRGMVSDDTEHTWITAHALLDSGGDPERFGRSLGRQLRLWLLCVPAGVGLATLRATLRLWLGRPYTRSGVWSAGNGPAMRSAILGVCYGGDMTRLRALTRVCTRITHTDPKAEAGALLVALAAYLSASGQAGASRQNSSEVAAAPVFKSSAAERNFADHYTEKKNGVVEDEQARQTRVDACCRRLLAALPPDADPFAALIEQMRLSARAGQSTEDFAVSLGLAEGVSGYVCHTVPVALHAWLRFPDDYAPAVLSVIRCGGDTDTTGAITGAIVGAGVGRAGIRAEWRRGLWEWPRTGARMEQLGARLAATVESGARGQPVRLNPLAVLGRNGLFLIVILLHGFRRLLPPY